MRQATRSDIDRLFEIYSHESVAPNMSFDPCSRSEFDEIFEEILAGGDVLVVDDEDGIAAVCKVIRRKRRLRHSAYLGSLAVHYSKQNSGVGKQFLQSILDQLKEAGVSRVELLVAADNARAIDFFKGFGFGVEGTHRNYFSRVGSDLLFDEHTMALVKNA